MLSGGAGPTTYFESFEGGFGSFTTMQLDEHLNPPDDDLDNDEEGLLNADGYRCQYNDPDWQNSNDPGRLSCYPNPSGLPDEFFFDVSRDRAFTSGQSLYYGDFIDDSLGFTTPLAQLEAVVTTDPINLSWQGSCSEMRTRDCGNDLGVPSSGDVRPALPNSVF